MANLSSRALPPQRNNNSNNHTTKGRCTLQAPISQKYKIQLQRSRLIAPFSNPDPFFCDIAFPKEQKKIQPKGSSREGDPFERNSTDNAQKFALTNNNKNH